MTSFQRRLTVVLLSAAVAAAAVGKAEKPLDLKRIAAGTWGFAAKGASCDDNPHTLTFALMGRTMTLRYTVGLDGEKPTEATYKLIETGPDYIRMQKVNETEKTTSGDLVIWDLVLLSNDSYCWHRADWRPEGCTQPATRCKRSSPPPN